MLELSIQFSYVVVRKNYIAIYIGAELGGAAGARAPPVLHNPRKLIV